ncbi:MAG: sodium:proton antiporter [Acidobacteriota bacterium]
MKTIVGAIFLGILAQVLAGRYKLPAILPLLLFGMAAGPFGLKLLDPGVLGHGLEVIIHLGVAVILFEGGLSLDPKQLRLVGVPLRNLLTLGTLITAVGAAYLAQLLTGISWGTAALFGAIVTVTGPTVIAPLLRHMVAPRKARTIMVSEGLMIDPIGAVLAYLVLLWIDRSGQGLRSLLVELLELSATGAVLGFAAGAIAVLVIRYRHMDDELSNLVILALLMGCFYVAEHQTPQSGILASVVMGLTVSSAHIPDLNPLKVFKGQLTILVISVLFILLSGQLDLGAVYRLGWEGLAVVGGLILLVRPLAVFGSIPTSHLDVKQKLLLALTAPRGIVAAAVASLSAIQLSTSKGDEAAILEGLVYLVIVVTCTWATIMAQLLPRWLGYVGDPSRRRVVLVGASPMTKALAGAFGAESWTPVVVDSAPQKLKTFRDRKISAVSGDAREAATYERAAVERDSHVLAVTPNDELNLLVAELVREEFGVEHPVVALGRPSGEFGSLRRAWVDLLSRRQLDIQRWNRRLEDGMAAIETLELSDDPDDRNTFRSLLEEHAEDLVVLCTWSHGKPHFHWSDEGEHFDRVTLLTLASTRSMLDPLIRHEDEPEGAPNAEE